MADKQTTGAGDWSDGSKWSGGTIPSATQSVQISHAMTKDSAADATADCTDVYIDNNITLTIGASGGLKANGVLYMSGTGATLAIGGRAVTFTGKINGATANYTGKITGTAGGSLTCDYIQTGNRITWDLQGSSGNVFTVHCVSSATSSELAGDGQTDVGAIILSYVDFEGDGSKGTRNLEMTRFQDSDRVENCAFFNWQYASRAKDRVLYKSCYFYDSDYGLGFPSGGSSATLVGCTFGKNRGGTSANNAYDIYSIYPGIATILNCEFDSPTPFSFALDAYAWHIMFASGWDKVAGSWLVYRNGGSFEKSADAKKSGDWGIKIANLTANASTGWLSLDIPIPVESGDTIAPSIYFVNTGADLDLHNTDNGLTFELDPGNEWGRNELIDADDLADSYAATVDGPEDWIEAGFTGGSVGGSSKKGTCILRVTLRKYVASAVVYLADLTW